MEKLQQNRQMPVLCFLFWFLHLAGHARSQESNFILNVNFIINEELPRGTPIGNVAAETNFGTNNGFTFRIVGEKMSSVVTLNSSTGELVTAKVIDREQDCQNEAKCEFLFQVTAVKETIYEVVSVSLTVNDINDNTPLFKNNKETINISESQPLNKEIPVSSANDLDKGRNNSVASIEFSSFSDRQDNFALTVSENPDGSFSVGIKLIKELDYETTQSYQLFILARDAGTPIRTGTLTLNINVIDDNDNRPIFEEPVINVKVTEDIAVGKSIVVMKANDKDSGVNGEVFYQLAQQQAAEIYEYFTIDPVTGELKVAKKLDYEPGNSKKTIYIVASDKGTPPRSAQATLFLTIEDAGNNPPQITLTYLKPEIAPDVISVSENASLEEAVVHVNVEDSDTGDNGNVTCRTYNTYFGLKEVAKSQNSVGYKIYVQRSLDRELIDTHNVTITCVDGGGNEANANFLVRVKDENDKTPRFSKPYYNTQMKENNTYGAKVIEVVATDEDIGENGRISYFVHQDYANEFEAEENTGIIRAKIALNREEYQDKVFMVLAIDHGTPPRTSTTTVQVAVEDVNDMVPIFTGNLPEYHFKVQEGLVSGSKVDQVTAIDDDQGDNKRLEYYILPQYLSDGSSPMPFTVMEDGNIYTNMELDREETSLYRFKVGVHDFGKPPLNNSVWVNVRVMDLNDEVPRFIFPSSANNNNSVVALNEISDIPIARVYGVDNDEGINKELMYFIVEGNTDEIFSLEPNSGNLFIVKYYHIATEQTFTLGLSVYDKGQVPLFSKETLLVTLKYSNATHVSASTDDKQSYVIIVVAVVVITVVLATTIIVVIILIRRRDLSKFGGGTKPPYVQTDRGLKGGSSHQLSSDKVYPEAQQSRNKKEVSFSLDEGDSLSSSDFKNLTLKDKKGLAVSRQSNLGEMPEEKPSQSQPINNLLASHHRYGNQQAKFLEQQEVQLHPSHQREDSHSETSGETTTSHDSGRGSVEGEFGKFDMNPLNSSAYLIKEEPNNLQRINGIPKSKDIPPKLPIKTSEVKRPSVLFNGNSQSRTRNWCQNLDSTGSYPDSDYLSMGSTHNYSHTNSYPEHGFPLGPYNNNHAKMSPLGYKNLGYGNTFPTYRSNSTRDDDETTTTSGSYTINHEDLEEDMAQAQYQVSQMV